MSDFSSANIPANTDTQSERQSSNGMENGPCLFGIQNRSTLDESQEMGPLATKIDEPERISQDITYYGIFVPKETQLKEDNDVLHVYEDKTEALKIVKRYKKARFKVFKSREDAVEFAVRGSEISHTVLAPPQLDNSETSSLVFEKPSLFKGPKAQDLVQLRRAIECGDLQVASSTVWSNPRYLVSSGDTPAILQEGSRYNALHVAAKARSTAMCEFIIQTISNPAFVGLLYGDDNAENCQERANILLDLYLNTPDKALNETPLHFAVKFGAVGVVEALVSCPQCAKQPKNKYGETPHDIVCSRVSKEDPQLKKEILSLLEDRFYVPVLRSEDNSVQPVVGTPFSPSSPPVLNSDPINPRLEIHAYAGPMSQEDAVTFRKKWKTPPRIQQTRKSDNTYSPMSPCLKFQDTEKGLERVGRELAQEFKVTWKEYWPFLGIFTDLSTAEGLQKLETYLKNRFMQVYMKSPPKENRHNRQLQVNKDQSIQDTTVPSTSANLTVTDGAISPITDLCLAFKACTLSDANITVASMSNVTRTSKLNDLQCGELSMDAENTMIKLLNNPGLSPFLYVEKSCQVFAKRISDGLIHLVVQEEIQDSQANSDSILDMLLIEVKHLQVLVGSYMDDPRFVSVDFHLVHSRIATLVAIKICTLSSWDAEQVVSYLQRALLAHKGFDIGSSDEEEITFSPNLYRTRKFAERRKKSNMLTQNHVRCLAQLIIGALKELEELDKNTENEARIDTEDDCIKVWSDAMPCTCNWHIQNFSRNSRKGSSLKRTHLMKPILHTDNGQYQPNRVTSMNCVSKRLEFDCDGGFNSNSSEPVCDTFEDESDKMENCVISKHHENEFDSDEESESDDNAFHTPPTSPEEVSSEEEMITAEEGIGVYIEGEFPSKMDLAVLQAIRGCEITPSEYPNVYRWQHLVMLHNEHERNSWASPAVIRRQQKLRYQCAASPQSSPQSSQYCRDLSSPQAWHRVAGQYSPARLNCHVD